MVRKSIFYKCPPHYALGDLVHEALDLLAGHGAVPVSAEHGLGGQGEQQVARLHSAAGVEARQLWPVGVPAEAEAASAMAVESTSVVDIGFSHQTCFPAFSAAMAISA